MRVSHVAVKGGEAMCTYIKHSQVPHGAGGNCSVWWPGSFPCFLVYSGVRTGYPHTLMHLGCICKSRSNIQDFPNKFSIPPDSDAIYDDNIRRVRTVCHQNIYEKTVLVHKVWVSDGIKFQFFTHSFPLCAHYFVFYISEFIITLTYDTTKQKR